jgi:hypothetical protein
MRKSQKERRQKKRGNEIIYDMINHSGSTGNVTKEFETKSFILCDVENAHK